MTINQAVFAIIGTMVALGGMFAGFFKYYIDAKIDPVAKQVDLLVHYMISHEGKIARLEERSGFKAGN